MQFLQDVIIFTIPYIIMWFSTVYIHEAGHYITAKVFGLTIKGFRIQKIFNIIPVPTAVNVNFEKRELENLILFNYKYVLVVIGGIIAGFIPVLIYTRYQESVIVNVFVCIVYLRMCSGDLTRLWDFAKGERLYEEGTIQVTIPESEEECASVYPECKGCVYFMEKECHGDKAVFPTIYKPTDVERFRKMLHEKYGDELE